MLPTQSNSPAFLLGNAYSGLAEEVVQGTVAVAAGNARAFKRGGGGRGRAARSREVSA